MKPEHKDNIEVNVEDETSVYVNKIKRHVSFILAMIIFIIISIVILLAIINSTFNFESYHIFKVNKLDIKYSI